jgi:hypothetical protein
MLSKCQTPVGMTFTDSADDGVLKADAAGRRAIRFTGSSGVTASINDIRLPALPAGAPAPSDRYFWREG